jgi:hypothetical protein
MSKIITDLKVIEEDTEFTQIATSSEKAVAFANDIKVTSEAKMNEATKSLTAIVDRKKKLESIRKAFVQPLNDHVGRINMLFKPSWEKYQEAEKILREKATNFQVKKEEAERKRREKIEKEAQEGKIDLEQAIDKAEKIKKTPTTRQTDDGAKLTFRTVRKLEIYDEKKLPREYLVPDRTKITKALKAGVEVPGAKMVEEKQSAVGY